MRNKHFKLFTIIIAILPIEYIIYFCVSNYQKTNLEESYAHKMEVEKLSEEKEKKKLNDEFEQNKYLASGKNAYERIYNNKQQDIVDLIHKLALESFPSSWKVEVMVEEFVNTILLVQVDANNQELEAIDIAKRLPPMLDCSEKYLKNVAIYNRKHQCYLFFDEVALSELIKTHSLSYSTIEDAKSKGLHFTRYNAIKIDFQESHGHILIPVVISGPHGSYDCTMMLDTGASMTVISAELAQKTGNEDLNNISRKTFSTAKGPMSCPIVDREIIVGSLDKKQPVAVNPEDDTNLLGVDFFESKGYIIDNSSKCIYVWSK